MKIEEVPIRCKSCKYLSTLAPLTQHYNEYICEYINVTGEPRGCKVDNNCNRYEKGEIRRKKSMPNGNRANWI